MDRVAHLLKKNRLLASVFLIFFISFFFGFYNYLNRWGLASDQARDAIIAIYAVKTGSIPLIGPFSASGPFVFGPYMYWFLMFIGTLFPLSFFEFWLAISFLSFVMVFFMILVGKELEDINSGLLLGLFASISTIRINLSTNLISSSLSGVWAMVSSYFLLRSIKRSGPLDFLFLGFFVGLAMNTHFQAVPLIILLPVALIFGKKSIKNTVLMFIGFLVPFIPLIIFDLKSNFYESTNILNFYLLHGGKTAVGMRWITYVTQLWPSFWNLTIGGNYFVSIATVSFTALTIAYFAVRKSLPREIGAIAVGYFLIFVFLRYFHGQIFGDFTAFISPFTLILIVWSLMRLMSFNKYLGYVAIFVICLFTMLADYTTVSAATNYSAPNAGKLEKILLQEFPKGTKFSIYDYNYRNTQISLPLVLYLYRDGKISDSGVRIGIAGSIIPNAQVNYFEKGRYTEFVYTLNNYSNDTLVKNGWVSVNPSNIYNSVENWYKK